MLVSLRKWAKASDVRLKLMNLTPKIEDLLDLMQLKSAFEICSVPEMLGLLCRAFEQSQFVNVDAAVDGSDGSLMTANLNLSSLRAHKSYAIFTRVDVCPFWSSNVSEVS
jgi:hypothetical protein